MTKVQAHLGTPVEIGVIINDVEYKLEYKKSMPSYMTAPPNGRSLFFIEQPKGAKRTARPTVEKNWEKIRKASVLFADWQDNNPGRVLTLNVDEKKWKKAGHVTHVIYDSKKWDNDDRYIHEFEETTYLWIPLHRSLDRAVPPLMKITGKYLRITQKGIEG